MWLTGDMRVGDDYINKNCSWRIKKFYSKNWWGIDRTLAWSQVFLTTVQLNQNAKEGHFIQCGKRIE